MAKYLQFKYALSGYMIYACYYDFEFTAVAIIVIRSDIKWQKCSKTMTFAVMQSLCLSVFCLRNMHT